MELAEVASVDYLLLRVQSDASLRDADMRGAPLPRRLLVAQDIQTLVVLMLENRSFDQMLGYLKAADPSIDGLTGTEWNPSNPLTPTDQIAVSSDAGVILDPDPGHSIEDTNVQLFSTRTGPPPVGMPNAGFIWNYS